MRYRFAPFLLDTEVGTLSGPEGEIKLRPQAFDLLRELVASHPRMVPKDELLDRVWGTFHVSANSLPQAISELRQALDDNPRTPRFIATVHRRGYRFVAQVAVDTGEIDSEVETGRIGTAVPKRDEVSTAGIDRAESNTAEISTTAGTASPRRRPLRAAMGLSLGLLLIVATLIVALKRWEAVPSPAEEKAAPALADVASRTLAVFGFRNAADDPDRAWLGTALTEMLGDELARAPDVRVIDGERVSRMRAELELSATGSLGPSTLERIYQRLGVEQIVLGNYGPAGSDLAQLRLELRVQDTRSAATLLTLDSSYPADQWLALVASIGARLRAGLGLAAPDNLPDALAGRQPPANDAALPRYFAARSALHRFDLAPARDLFQEAAHHDPESAAIQANLAAVQARLGAVTAARQAAHHAQQRAAALPAEERLNLEALAHILRGQPLAAAALYRARFEQGPPSLESGLPLATALLTAGQGRQALELVEALRPLARHGADRVRLDLLAAEAAGAVSELAQQRQLAARAAETGQAMGAQLQVAAAHYLEGEAYAQGGEIERATQLLEQSYRLSLTHGDHHTAARALGAYAAARAARGDLEAGEDLARQALALSEEIGNQRLAAEQKSRLAHLALLRGRQQEARDLLDEALARYTASGDRAGEAEARLELADIAGRQGELEPALAHIDTARQLYQQRGDRRGEARAWNLQGAIAGRSGGFDEAARAFERALALFREIGDRQGEAEALGHRANVASSRGHLQEASRLFSQALDLQRQTGSAQGLAKLLYNVSLVYLRTGKVAAAADLLEESLAAFEGMDQHLNACWVRRKLGDVWMQQGRLDAARPMLEQALARCREAGSRSAEGHGLSSLGSLATHQGDLQAAAGLHRQALDLRRALAQNGNAAVDELALAQLAWRDGRRDEAAAMIHHAGLSLASNSPAWQALHHVWLARLRATEGAVEEARSELETATALLVESEDLSLQLEVELRRCRVLIEMERHAAAQEAADVVIASATKAGFAALALEARLLHLEAKRRGGEDADEALAALERQAQAMGFGDVARQAARLRDL